MRKTLTSQTSDSLNFPGSVRFVVLLSCMPHRRPLNCIINKELLHVED